MASSIVLLSDKLKSSVAIGSFRSSNGLGFRNDVRPILPWNVEKSRVYMSIVVGSQATTAVDDALFKDYKPSSAFLFPGQSFDGDLEDEDGIWRKKKRNRLLKKKRKQSDEAEKERRMNNQLEEETDGEEDGAVAESNVVGAWENEMEDDRRR